MKKKPPKNHQPTIGPIQRFINNPVYQKFDLRIPREKTKEEIDAERPLYENICAAFSGVDRRGGISLHETYAVDLYGSQSERAALRKLDTDTSWQKVKWEWIENFSGLGGLSFFDDIGLRYYTPAYFRWYFERDHLSESLVTSSLVFTFTWKESDVFDLDDWKGKRLRVFSPSQASAIQGFLEHLLKHNPDEAFLNTERINTSIAKFWSKLASEGAA